MIRAITSFKPNSTNANFSNRCCKNSQPSFKGKEQEYAEAFTEVLGKYTDAKSIEYTFLQFVADVALESETAARSFANRFRKRVPDITTEKIEQKIQETLDFQIEQMAPRS